MTIHDIVSQLEAKVICGEGLLEKNIEYAFASDLLSDVLTLDSSNLIMITGLANMQTIRTAEMLDITNILLVRNKKTTADMKKAACENNMVLIEYSGSMFRACGILYNAGLKPVY
jgi:hypothetical protein